MRFCFLFLPKLFPILFVFFTSSLLAQSSFTYTALCDNEAAKKTLLDATKKRYESDVASLAGNNKKYIADVYKDRYNSIAKYYTDSTVITDSKAEQYLQSILSEIVNSNPALRGMEIRVLFSREYYPNAFCAGEGTILFNISLFSRLQNESQAAFVLCHELSHQYLNHNNKYIQQYVGTLYSDTFQHKLQQINKAEYGKRQLLEQTMTGISFSSRRHGREHEAEADSMALEFMKNTQYNVSGALSCLALLDSVDKDKYNVSPRVDSVFNTAEYPFQPAWVKAENSFFSQLAASSLQETEQERDSLKTHPDCKLRIEKLQEKEAQYYKADGKDFIVMDSAAFRQWQQTFDFEIVNYAYGNGALSRSLYYSMQMLQTYPANVYLVTNIGRCFNTMYAAQKAHTLGKLTDMPSPFGEKKYNDFLQFLQRLRLPEMAAINYYFLSAYASRLSSDKNFADVYQKSKQLFNN